MLEEPQEGATPEDEEVEAYLDGASVDEDIDESSILDEEEEYVPEDVPILINPDALSKLRRFMEARDLRDDLETQLATAKKEYRQIEEEVHLMLASSELTSRLGNIDLGDPWGVTSFGAMETTYARVLDEDKAKAHFEKTGASGYIRADKLVMARLNEEVRQAEEAGESAPPGLDSYKKRYVQITRQKD